MERVIEAARKLSKGLEGLVFDEPVACVYQPLEYAWRSHERYIREYGRGKKRVIFLGMNPGPYGMAQTGVPFGEIAAVRDWMKIEEVVEKPKREHPKRPIEGFGCKKSEVSGRRLWGLFAERFPQAKGFFKDHYVLNYCPLVWMSASGANLTPDKIGGTVMDEVERECMKHLVEVIRAMEPAYVIGVGGYAEERLKRAVEGLGEVRVGRILHPSPASPAANRGWAQVAERQLTDLGVW